jgi:hypothetical protein
MGTNQTKFHDPYLSDLSKKSVWTVTLGPLKNTDEFLKILVEDQKIHDLLGYINTITHITHVEYTGRITNNIKITFVCDKNENINEAYITQKIRESISRHAELSDGKYYKNLLVKDVKLETAFDWQKQHFKSLEAAYRTSPFFEYFEDALLPIFNKKHTFLMDLNIHTKNYYLN